MNTFEDTVAIQTRMFYPLKNDLKKIEECKLPNRQRLSPYYDMRTVWCIFKQLYRWAGLKMNGIYK